MNVSMENLYVDIGAYRVKEAETIFVQNTNCDPLCRKHIIHAEYRDHCFFFKPP